MDNAHRKRNFLTKIKENGVWLIEAREREIKEGVAKAFKTFEEGDWRLGIDAISFEVLDDQRVWEARQDFHKGWSVWCVIKIEWWQSPKPKWLFYGLLAIQLGVCEN